eukprot:365930-Chlamydomonas_euryale.AAC.5
MHNVGSVTLRHILTHTASIVATPGLEPLTFLEQLMVANLSMTLAESAAVLTSPNPNSGNGQEPRFLYGAAPGTAFRYTSVGFQVLGAVAEAAGGAPWRELLAKYVTEPLGMRHTSMYNMWGEPDPMCSNPTLAYGLISTADDMWAFVSMLAGAHEGGRAGQRAGGPAGGLAGRRAGKRCCI